jgi:TRAP-type uncharacterized transport system substrate-binding protein
MDIMQVAVRRKLHSKLRVLSSALVALVVVLSRAASGGAQETLEVGATGFDVKRPVLASACEHGCPWGELGDFVAEAMKPLGYEVILCRNCNRDQGPPLVASASYPPALGPVDMFVGTTTRVNAPVDFGVTESGLLAWAYAGLYNYAQHGPYANLRLIAKIEDPTYLLAAVNADSGITDISQIAERKLAVKILGGDSPIAQPILDHYGLTQSAVTAWGGSFQNAIIAGQADDPAFDLVINELASPANNVESAFWTKISQKHALRFLDLPEEVLDRLSRDKTLGLTRVTAKWGLLRGVDRAIPTVARSGEAIFARDDLSVQAAYDAAKAIDEYRHALKWYIRPYSYDSRTVWENLDVPLHPGAARYYREQGYLSGSGADAGAPAPAQHVDTHCVAAAGGGGCSVARGKNQGSGVSSLAAVLLPFVCWCWRRGRRSDIMRRAACR